MPKQLSADIDLHGRKRVRPTTTTTTANDKLALIAFALHSIYIYLFKHLCLVLYSMYACAHLRASYDTRAMRPD